MEFPLGGVRYNEVENNVSISLFLLIEPSAKIQYSKEISDNSSIVVKHSAQRKATSSEVAFFSCFSQPFGQRLRYSFAGYNKTGPGASCRWLSGREIMRGDGKAGFEK